MVHRLKSKMSRVGGIGLALFLLVLNVYLSWEEKSETAQAKLSVFSDPTQSIATNDGKEVVEQSSSILVLMSVKIRDETQISKEMTRIHEDYSYLCSFHSKCHWMINLVATDHSLLRKMQSMPHYTEDHGIRWFASVSTETFNKYSFVKTFIKDMVNYDLLLLKDNDMRITSFSWPTFLQKRSNSIISGPLRLSEEPERQWFQIFEAYYWYDPSSPHWSRALYNNTVPIDVPYLECSFALFDAKFANYFFPLALKDGLLHPVSDHGPDLAWCGGANSWGGDGARPGCYLIPGLVSNHEDTRQIKKGTGYQDAVMEAREKYSEDPIVGKWMRGDYKWRQIIGGRHSFRDIESSCRQLIGLDEGEVFYGHHLQSCATRSRVLLSS